MRTLFHDDSLTFGGGLRHTLVIRVSCSGVNSRDQMSVYVITLGVD